MFNTFISLIKISDCCSFFILKKDREFEGYLVVPPLFKIRYEITGVQINNKIYKTNLIPERDKFKLINEGKIIDKSKIENINFDVYKVANLSYSPTQEMDVVDFTYKKKCEPVKTYDPLIVDCSKNDLNDLETIFIYLKNNEVRLRDAEERLKKITDIIKRIVRSSDEGNTMIKVNDLRSDINQITKQIAITSNKLKKFVEENYQLRDIIGTEEEIEKHRFDIKDVFEDINLITLDVRECELGLKTIKYYVFKDDYKDKHAKKEERYIFGVNVKVLIFILIVISILTIRFTMNQKN